MVKKFDLDAALSALGWSQAELARRVEVHVNTVSGWSTGRTQMPGPAKAYMTLAMKAKEMLE